MENKNTENKNMENMNVENAENESRETEEKRSGKGRKKGIIAAAAAAAVVVIVLIVCWFMGVIGGISEAEAREVAYGQVQGASDDGSALVIKEFDDGRMIYDVQIVHDGTIYDFTILARNGDVVSREMESINNGENSVNAQSGQNTSQSSQSSDIGVDKAKEIALAQVDGASTSHITKASAEMDDGRYMYEVEIIHNHMEYDFEIDAATGEIISYTRESVYD